MENDCSTLIIRGSPDAHPREFETSLFFSANETNMLTNRLQLEHSRPLRPEKKMGTFKAAPAFILITLCETSVKFTKKKNFQLQIGGFIETYDPDLRSPGSKL